MVPRLGGAGLLPRRPLLEGEAVLHRHSAPERHRLPSHRPCAQQRPPGHPGALEAHGRLQRPLAARYGPRRDRHAGGRGAAARGRGHEPRGARARGLHPARVEVEGGVRRHDPPAAEAPGRVLRLGAGALHHGSRPVDGRPGGLRPALGGGPHLPGRLHRQLVPPVPDGSLRPRGRVRGPRGRALLHQVRPPVAGHRAPGDEARRHRAGRPPEGSPLREVRRAGARDPVGRGDDPDEGRRRRRRRPQVRHGRHQGHARPRPRPTSRSGGATASRSARSSASTGR